MNFYREEIATGLNLASQTSQIALGFFGIFLGAFPGFVTPSSPIFYLFWGL